MPPAHPPPKPLTRTLGPMPWRYALVLLIWLLATAAALAFVVRSSLNRAELEFAEYVDHFHAQLRDKLRANEAVLYGFASFLGAIERDDPRQASRYARSMLERYPHIYMLEIVRHVPRGELAEFTRAMRRTGHERFEVRRFDYRSERRWSEAPPKDSYYPVILAEPEQPEARDILGLDIDSLSGLKAALRRSEKLGQPAASEPFRLVEGDIAYIMIRPVETNPVSGATARPILGGQTYALLLMRAAELLPPPADLDQAVRHVAYLRTETGTTDGATENLGLLFDLAPQARHRVGHALFQNLRIERSIEGVSQPVLVVLERRLGLSDISGSAAGMVALASMLSLALLLAYIGARQRHEQTQAEVQRAMEHLALHDGLTGLPNRYLMLGRLEQSLSAAQRHGTRLAVLFLDLDGFKPINDCHGHHVGDELLKAIANRLRDCIRDCDTVARHGGDEFVITLTDIGAPEHAAAVAEKILLAVAEPIVVDGLSLEVTTSIGIACFPEAGENSDALIRAADAAMYEAKAEGRRIYRFAAPGDTVPQATV